MLIRPANPADIAALLPMITRICALHESWDAAKYTTLPHPEKRYEGWIARLLKQPQNVCLVAEVTSPNPVLAGFLIATVEPEIPIYRLKEYGFIQDLWVEADYRQQGIARDLIQQAIAHFKTLGVEQVRLETAIANETARQMFQSLGFRPSVVEFLMEI